MMWNKYCIFIISIILIGDLVQLNNVHKRQRKFIRHALYEPIPQNNVISKKYTIPETMMKTDEESDLVDMNSDQLDDAFVKDLMDLDDPDSANFVNLDEEANIKREFSPKTTSNRVARNEKRNLEAYKISDTKGWMAERKYHADHSFEIQKPDNSTKIEEEIKNVIQTAMSSAIFQNGYQKYQMNDTSPQEESEVHSDNATTLLYPETEADKNVTSDEIKNENSSISSFETMRVLFEAMKEQIVQIRVEKFFNGKKKLDPAYASENKTSNQLNDSICVNFSSSMCHYEQVRIVCTELCQDFNETLPSSDGSNYCDVPAGRNSCCKFPFVYQKQIYNACTTIHREFSWCALTESFDRDGEWAPCHTCGNWSRWSECSNSCGLGQITRVRTCRNTEGTSRQETQIEPCQTDCKVPVCSTWSEWSECSKPCNSGVQSRSRDCTYFDGSSKQFYEHRVCNTQECVEASTTSTSTYETTPSPKELHSRQHEEQQTCLTAYLSFDSYQEIYHEVHDESQDHNDLSISYQGPRMFNGNFTCGYGAYFFRHASFLTFRDDIFRNSRLDHNLTISFWINPSPITELLTSTSNLSQTIFYLDKMSSNFGVYHLYLNSEQKLIWSVEEISDSQPSTTTSNRDSIATSVKNKSSDHSIVISVSTDFSLVPGMWYHVGAVYNHATQQVALYLNEKTFIGEGTIQQGVTNIQQQTSTYPAYDTTDSMDIGGIVVKVPGTKLDNSGQFQGIGNSPSLDSQFMGLLDEVYILKCPLSYEQNKALANICRIREDANCSSPLLGFCSNCPSCHHKVGTAGELDEVIPQTYRVSPISS